MKTKKKDRFSLFVERRILDPIENAPYRWGHWLVLILMSVAVRNLLESALEYPHIIGVATEPLALHTVEENFFHLPFFYLVTFFLLILILKLCSGESIQKVTKALATFSPIIILPPILDTLLFHFRGYRLLYPTQFQQLFAIFWRSITNPFGEPVWGVSQGMRVEVVLGALMGSAYVFFKRRNVLWALLGLVMILVGCAVIGGIPALVAQISGALLHIKSPVLFNLVYYGAGLISSSVRKWGLVMLGVFTLELVVWYVVYNRQAARRYFKNFFSLGGWAYASVLVAGFLLALGMLGRAFTTLFDNIFDFLAPAVMVVVGLLFHTVQTLVRSLYGGVRDPVAGADSVKEDRAALVVSALLLFFYSLALGYSFLLLVLFALGILWMYQMPPLNLSRFFPASTLFWSAIVLALALAGFSSFGATRTVMIFPWRLLTWVLLAGIPALAVKDFYGDQPGFNLRTLLGPRVGRVVAGVLLAAALVLTPFILKRAALWPYALVLGPASFAVFMILPKDPKPLIGCAMLFIASVTFVLFRKPILNVPELESGLKTLGSFYDAERYLETAGISVGPTQASLFEKAVTSYSAVLENNPDDIIDPTSLHFRLGFANMGINQYFPAAIQFEKAYSAVRLGPFSYIARAPAGGAYGFSLFKLGQDAEAKVVYDELAKEGWDLGKVYYELAILEKRKGKLDRAERYFAFTVLLGEMIDEGLNRLAGVRALKGDPVGAELFYKRALFYNPFYVPFYTSLGSFYWDQKRFAAAESVYRRALKLEPRDPMLYNNLAMSIDAQGRWQMALPFFGRALQINPRFTDAYLNLAVVFERVGLVDRARLALAEVLRYDPGNTTVRSLLARLDKKTIEGGNS